MLKFCEKVEQLYGKSLITPNMHLHAHLSECVKDYGSIYEFWLFAFERYNGTLGNFPTNKKAISEQLMRRFIYKAECSHLIPLVREEKSEIHQQVLEHISSSNQSGLTSVVFPSTSKYTALTLTDHDNCIPMCIRTLFPVNK